jgi:NAD(P)-dependent dehydrogenase (short-subunit alcohol dehydrogenase family)
MSTDAISRIPGSSPQEVSAIALQRIDLTSRTTYTTIESTSFSDIGQLSPLAIITGPLLQLQEADPIKYEQVTDQIAVNLQSAAHTAQAHGEAAAVTRQLTQLATDFSDASHSGDIPNLQDLAQAVGASGTTDAPNSSTKEALKHLLAGAAEPSDSHSTDASLDPSLIILQTLSGGGIPIQSTAQAT